MKASAIKLIILMALTTSGLLFSQNSQPNKIELGGVEGVFIDLSLMDSISVKLIERNALKSQIYNLEATIENLNKSLILETEKQSLLINQKNKALEAVLISEEQTSVALESLEKQKIITQNIKAKARKNGLLLFGGGVSLGMLAALILN